MPTDKGYWTKDDWHEAARAASAGEGPPPALAAVLTEDDFANTLRNAEALRTVVRLNPEQAGALFVRLAELEAIRQRAQEARDSDIWVSGVDAAQWILTGQEPSYAEPGEG